MAENEYSQVTRKTLVKQRNEAINEKEVAETKAIKLQNKNYLLTTALVVESIVLGLVIIFK